MEVRRLLVKFLSDLRALQLSNERQAFIGNMGFDRLRSKIKWEGDAQAFADHLVLVLTRQGRKTLLEFITNLRDSNMVGVDRKEELEKMRSAIAGLKRPQWIREFVFVAIPIKWVALGLAVLLLASTPALWFGYQVLQAPAEMTGTFNIALADFGQLNNNGQPEPIEDGRTMSTWLFKGLTSQSLGPNFWIWHDSMSLTEKRAQIGIIPGSTSEERRANAARVARSINADMLVYGVLTSGPTPDLNLEFYVAPLGNMVEETVEEILATYALGSPIAVTLPIRYSDARAEVEDVLLDRSEVLTFFMQGLNKEKSGRPLEALAFFKQALDEEYWGSNTEGQEVVYLFIGRQHYALGGDYQARGEMDKALEEYKEAYEAFQKSKALNPKYARPYIDEGHMYYSLASQTPMDDRLTTPCLDLSGEKDTLPLSCVELSIEVYKQAVALADSPGGSAAYADVRAHISLGVAYRTHALLSLYRGGSVEALPLYDMAIEEQGKAIALLEGKFQPGYLAFANKERGLVYHQKGYMKRREKKDKEASMLYEKASADFTACIEVASAQPDDRGLQGLVQHCQWRLEDLEKAIADLEK